MKENIKKKNELNVPPGFTIYYPKSDLPKIANSEVKSTKEQDQCMNLNTRNGELNVENNISSKEKSDIFDGIVRVEKEGQRTKISYDPADFEEMFKESNKCYAPNNIRFKDALLLMLQVIHSFKFAIDDSEEWYKTNTADTIPLYLPHLLLEILYEINGSHARLRDLDPFWEDEFEEILRLPNCSRELDSAITEFLLLPLYFATHPHLDEQN